MRPLPPPPQRYNFSSNEIDSKLRSFGQNKNLATFNIFARKKLFKRTASFCVPTIFFLLHFVFCLFVAQNSFSDPRQVQLKDGGWVRSTRPPPTLQKDPKKFYFLLCSLTPSIRSFLVKEINVILKIVFFREPELTVQVIITIKAKHWFIFQVSA